MKNAGIIIQVFKNKILQYIFSRYAVYFIQFINSLFIAAYLGPYYLGIWGFFNLVLQYLGQLNFGIPHAVSAIISVHKNREWYTQKVVGTSLTMFAFLSSAVILFFIANACFDWHIGDKYEFSKFTFFVVLTGILVYFNAITAAVIRVYGKLSELAFTQSVFPVLVLVALFFFKGEHLLWALVIANFVSVLVGFIVYAWRMPIRIQPIFIPRLCKYIQVRGWHLFIYNTSFYLIGISMRSFVSEYYSVEEFGYFTFAFTMASVGLGLMDSFSFIIYPKVLNRFASGNTEKIQAVLNTLRDTYIATAHLLIHLAILFFPLLLSFFPQYEASKSIFYLIALTVVLGTNAFGFSDLLIAKKQEKKLGYLTLLALVINICMTFILAAIVKVPVSQIILSTMITNLFLIFGIGYLGREYLGLQHSRWAFVQNIFPLQLLVPFLVSICLIFLEVPNLYYILPVLLFVSLNWKRLLNLKKIGKEIVYNPQIINI